MEGADTGNQEIGPELPPEMGEAFTTDKDKSALKESIKKKGQNSYYYAHNYDGQNFDNDTAKKVYGDGIIHGGAPTLIMKKESNKEEEKKAQSANPLKKIAKYSWNDEDAKIKIYIDLSQFPTEITKDMVDVEFQEYGCEIKVMDQNGTQHVLSLQKLYEKIEVDKSTWRHSEKRISITFKKWLETKWFSLLKG